MPRPQFSTGLEFMTPRSRPRVKSGVGCLTNGASQGPENHTALSCVSVTLFEIGKWREGQDGGRVGSPSHLSPPNYPDNLQIILKIYEFSLRFKERTAGTLQ